MPVTITLRGTEVPLARTRLRRRLMLAAVGAADQVFAVADSLRRHVAALGADGSRIEVIGNGVDSDKFRPADRAAARRRYGIAADAPTLISVGGLVPRKGFHRVIDCLPELRRRHPGLRYLVVGGPSPEGDMTHALREQVETLGLQDCVTFIGPVPAAELRWPLSAADVFVLATANEGWANVFLEAMACGLPVVTTDVGGNREVVSDASLGTVVPFGDQEALTEALDWTLSARWDRAAIRDHARANDWEGRVDRIEQAFAALLAEGSTRTGRPATGGGASQ